MPSRVTVSDIKSKFLRPSLTSYFEVEVPIPRGVAPLQKWGTGGKLADKVVLLCTEAVLPGSNLATFETNNDRTGVTERFAHRRIFDERIDLTFNVDAGLYSPIKFFEEWIDYITGAATTQDLVTQSDSRNELRDSNYYYRMRYPSGDRGYMAQQGLIVRKFERDPRHYKIESLPSQPDPSRGLQPGFKFPGIENKVKMQTGRNNLTYQFVNAYPISISSMPVAYDSSSVLKCTVSFTYVRYYIENLSQENINT